MSEIAPAQAARFPVAVRTVVDEAGFEEIVRAHQSMVFGIAFNTLQDRDAAEEVAQDVFLRLYRDRSTIESPDHLVYWLRRVTSNRCIDALRRRRWRLVAIDEVDAVTEHEPEDPLALRAVRRLIGSLPAKQRVVLALRYQEELEIAEIARTLEMPVNTIKSHLRRAVEALRRGLATSGDPKP